MTNPTIKVHAGALFTRPVLTGDFGVAWNPSRRSPLMDAFEAHCRAHTTHVP